MNEEQLINKVKQNPNLKEEKRKKKKPWLWGAEFRQGWNLDIGGVYSGAGPRLRTHAARKGLGGVAWAGDVQVSGRAST